jgi:hypothetical protein
MSDDKKVLFDEDLFLNDNKSLPIKTPSVLLRNINRLEENLIKLGIVQTRKSAHLLLIAIFVFSILILLLMFLKMQNTYTPVGPEDFVPAEI